VYIGESSLDDCSAQVFPYNIFAYCSICRVDCKFARNKKKFDRRNSRRSRPL
jgi:tmRNA-binding protein